MSRCDAGLASRSGWLTPTLENFATGFLWEPAFSACYAGSIIGFELKIVENLDDSR
jgi:hypothetical protein